MFKSLGTLDNGVTDSVWKGSLADLEYLHPQFMQIMERLTS